ncbi:hypothetical protein ACWDE0_32435 [Streptomyces sp. 900105755]
MTSTRAAPRHAHPLAAAPCVPSCAAPGDTVDLRIQDARTKSLRTVPFHYAGIAKEFPTAPKDSFFVANAAYIAQATV